MLNHNIIMVNRHKQDQWTESMITVVKYKDIDKEI